MYILYLLALLPVIVGLIIWIKCEKIIWQEWLIGSAVSFLTAGILHFTYAKHLTGDTETWSGKVLQVEYHPKWVETYQQARTRSVASGRDSKGRTTYRTEIYYTTEYAAHDEHWEAKLDFGSTTFSRNIEESDFNIIKKDFGPTVDFTGRQSTKHGGTRFSGDNSFYATRNKTGVLWPVTTSKFFENRIKAAPSVFSFAPPPVGVKTFQYPVNRQDFVSDRVIGQAKSYVNLRKWDEMNSRLGPKKLVNVIIIGFGNTDSMMAQYQESAWIGGKKNDLVLTFGSNNHKPTWTKVFGWTESETCKRNLETILLKNLGTTNDIIGMVEREITANYKIKDWSKFDYISIEPTTKQLVWFIIILTVTQISLWIYFHQNDYIKLDFLTHKFKSVYSSYYSYRR